MALLRRQATPTPVQEVEPQALTGETMAEAFQREFIASQAGSLTDLYRYGASIDEHLRVYREQAGDIPDFIYKTGPHGNIEAPIQENPSAHERREIRSYLKAVGEYGPLLALWANQLGADEIMDKSQRFFSKGKWREVSQIGHAVGTAISESAPQRSSLLELQNNIRPDASGQVVARLALEKSLNALLTKSPKLLIGIVDWLEQQPTASDGSDSPVKTGLIDFLAGSYGNGQEQPGIIRQALASLKADARPFFADRDPLAELFDQADVQKAGVTAWLQLFEMKIPRDEITALLLTQPLEDLPVDIQRHIKTAGQQLADEVDTALAAHLKPYYYEHKYRYPPSVEQFLQICDQMRAAADFFKHLGQEPVSRKRAGRMGAIVLPVGLEGAQRSLQKQVDNKGTTEKAEAEEKPVFVLKRTGSRQFEVLTASEDELNQRLHDDLSKYHDENAENDMRQLLRAIRLEPTRATKYGNVRVNIGGNRSPIWGAKVGDYPAVPTTAQISRDLRLLFANTNEGIHFIMAHHKDQQKEIVRSLEG